MSYRQQLDACAHSGGNRARRWDRRARRRAANNQIGACSERRLPLRAPGQREPSKPLRISVTKVYGCLNLRRESRDLPDLCTIASTAQIHGDWTFTTDLGTSLWRKFRANTPKQAKKKQQKIAQRCGAGECSLL